MKKILIAAGLLCMLVGIFGFSYTYSYDHRTAESLSAYCRIDFQSSHTETGALEGAVLTLWDSRYDTKKLLPQAVLYTDGTAWEMVATVKQSPPPGESDPANRFKNENKLFCELPKASLKAVRNAETVRVRFYYEGGQTIDLPLNAPDLEYWKAQLQ
ncbi:hypothetical protein [uncultured Selenomonas sp.]|jgi:hypothetical protein|uniref:hypothetical protein n=1 Tax=uncultured Selenomonas sp. TaxID=159275 RepID=UPI0025CD840B|nr:hypothetical protein [uncultured Selenomonas sp.]